MDIVKGTSSGLENGGGVVTGSGETWRFFIFVGKVNSMEFACTFYHPEGTPYCFPELCGTFFVLWCYFFGISIFFSHSFLLLSIVLFLLWFGDVFGGNCCPCPSVVSCVVLFPECFSLCCGDDASFLCFAPCQVFPGVLLHFCWHFLCFFVVFFFLAFCAFALGPVLFLVVSTFPRGLPKPCNSG